MKRPEIFFPRLLWTSLCEHLLSDLNQETMAMAFFSTSSFGPTTRLLVKALQLPQTDDYHMRSGGFVALSAEFMERCISVCERTNLHLLDIHTHPWSGFVDFSAIDDQESVDTKIPYMETYLPATLSAFLVMGKCSDIVNARIWDKNRQLLSPVARIRIV